MNALLSLINWKRCIAFTIATLLLLVVFNFYGLYTNKFYFFKIDNYIFPLLVGIHFVYLYVLKFKIREDEYTDPQMRNLEYALYGVFLVYIFKAMDTLYILLSYGKYQDHIMPETFMTFGITIISLQIFLILLTLIAVLHRVRSIGPYSFDNINENIDSWS
ncbi:hypothetical protein [Eudoraea chungangensis]|uniref:hypothetical protein n=1 Tax=Eudoraea chungangensis TaxID=1481905 RepID=UPI0023EC0DB3|nr:hypothetical protein [Eudoraea chungangensis]